MSLLIVAYPELNPEGFELIQDYRKDHDPLQYDIIKPHFTLVFPVFNFQKEDFILEVCKQLSGFNAFEFSIRCATVHKDEFIEQFHTYLVPDEGHSNFVKIHDKLYSGNLSSNHRIDIDFIPHISIGNSKNMLECKGMADEWNATDFCIQGRISILDILNYDSNVVTTLERIPLQN